MSDVLLTLFQAGWEPMTPLDMGLHLKESAKSGPQVTICFKQKEELATDSALDVSRVSLDPVLSEHSCLCLETYGSNYLGFHNISNTTLHEIVTSLTCEWPPGLVGVSGGVSSVISDYMSPVMTPATLPADISLPNQKYIQLEGEPWSRDGSSRAMQRYRAMNSLCESETGYPERWIATTAATPVYRS